MDKAYEPNLYEDKIYKLWEESGFFNPDNLSGEPFSILFPPPNVTGVLHLGHALENSLMDAMARYQRMNGKKVLLLPGTDHAAVATQAKVEKELVKQGIKHPREELGREGLLEKIREYANNSKATILGQIKKMGTSCDWSRLAYTFDEKRSRAVNDVFVRMYNDGLIYRGYRVVNWSVKGQSTCSDDELVYIDRPAKLYTFKYSKDFPFLIATTRPETKLGDTAVAVNPKDKRYKKYIGKVFTVDVGAKEPLKLKVIADENVEPDFGTGALGVTPAHSAVDYGMYEKQLSVGDAIGLISVIGKDGRMTEAAGKDYVGLKAEEAREKFVSWLKENSLLEKEEDITQSVGTSDRFGDVVEALPMTQWFVNVNKKIAGKNKSLKDLMKEAVSIGHNGDPKKKIKITPDRFEKIYFSWIDNLRDWCISRQIWWGHRIPVWYKNEEIYVDVKAPKGSDWNQDPDTLDTWFSSGLWTFSTLGWPEKTNDLKLFHPTSWMQMGHEILFFWMARMILMTTYTVDQIPFKDVYIHGMLRDEKGQKFSKSADNGIDPLDVIKTYGCDSLRLSVLSGISPGSDSKFYKEKIEGARNLVNKIWNISRYILSQGDGVKKDGPAPVAKTLADKWILTRLESLTEEVTKLMDNYEFSLALEKLREFTWSDFADWYLEISKIESDKKDILNFVLLRTIKLWHPFIPFVTEAIWDEVNNGEKLLMMEKWPTVIARKRRGGADAAIQFGLIKNIITGIRSLRADYKIDPVKKLKAVISAGKKQKLIEENSKVIIGLARLDSLEYGRLPAGSVGFVVGGVEVFVDLSGVVDLEKEKTRLKGEIDGLEKYLNGLEMKLGNESFVKNAPKEVVEKEKMKMKETKEKLEKLKTQLKSL